MAQKIKVFSVDDHGFFREGLKAIVANEPNLEWIGDSGDPNTALDLIAELKPNIIILDILMPHLNGIDLLRLIKDKQPNVKVIFLSQTEDPDYLKQIIEIGVDGFLLKSDPPSDLIRALSSITDGTPYFSPKIGALFFDFLRKPSASKNGAHLEHQLTSREIEVARLIAKGKTNKEIAQLIGCSAHTVKCHKTNLLRKTGAKNAAELVAKIL